MKNNYKKLSKAAVATVLASSGILVALPPAANAYVFKDLNPNADYYKPVLDLVNRGVVSGYSDGTFRPSETVTRGEAAKIIALAMGLNVTRQKNPGFTDVQQSHPYYAYIAAIANEGIIDGFGDKTFKPNELITRGQIAKALTLGFQLEVATKMNHNFKDVTSQNANEAYIQTLYNLNIAKGTTANTFEPFGTVTRAQLATFIWRAEKADKGNPSYNVGDIRGDIIYINGVQYTIGSSLKTFINEGNAAVLKGAVIDGTFDGKTLTGINELTLNASGTANRLIALDGGGANFNGNLTINGSYLRVKNMKLYGRTTVAEVPRKSLADYMQRIQGLNVASISGVGFIDWSQPNVPDDNSYLNPKDNEVLKPVPDKDARPNTRYSARMPKVDGYVDFEYTHVANLFIERNNTFVSADETLSRVTIARDVEQAEIYADMTTMYIETERNLVLYGVHNIETVYKNNYKSVYFNTDSFIDFLYVDNSSGWIDLGEHVYIDRVILPKDKKPNQIFDDFENDNDKIGNITDPDGKPVDREEEDKEIPDETRPIVTITSVDTAGVTATATFTSNEDGTYYWLERKASERPPTIREVLQANQEKRGTVKADTPTSFTINNLEEETDYILYLVVVDGAGNVSEKAEAEFSTTDGTPPRVLNLRAEPMHGGQRVKFFFTPSEPGDYYYFIRRATTAADPTTADIIANPTGTGRATSRDVIEEIIYDRESNTDYEIFVVMRDRSGNISENPPAKTTTRTSALDEEHPYVVEGRLESKGNNQFELTVNEALDFDSANNPDNYLLTGTVIVNVAGEKGIKPSKVEYKAGSRKVLLTIPSNTGFVNGDTLRVTVLPGVKDLAGKAFENVNTVTPGDSVRNFAEYVHEDKLSPTIKIENVINKADESDGFRRAEVEFKPNKAGSYYYMIVPNTVTTTSGDTVTLQQYLTDNNITERDFVNEWANSSSDRSGKFQIDGKNIYVLTGTGPANLETSTQKFPISIEQNKLNPFNSYSIYMVLRDRGGELSKIAGPNEIFGDVKAPLIRNLEIKPKENDDTKATISFETNETVKLHYWFVPKKIKDTDGLIIDNPEANLTAPADKTFLEAELKKKPYVEKIDKGLSGVIDARGVTLTAHTEYVVYVGAEDTYGNFTIYKANSNYTDHDQTATGFMKQNYYADGTAPNIGMVSPIDKKHYPGLIYRNSDSTFTITFSETIMRDVNGKSQLVSTGDTVVIDLSTILTITSTDANGIDIDVTNQYEPVRYTVGTDTTKDSQLIIRPKAPNTGDRTITVKMKDNAKDFVIPGYEGYNFVNEGKYLYRELDAMFMEIKLAHKTVVGDDKKVQVTFDLLGSVQQLFENGEELKYYYLADTAGTNENVIINRTAAQVIQAVTKGTDSSLAKGTGIVATNVARITRELEHPAKFFNGDYITIVLEDKYGNFNKFYAKVGYRHPSIDNPSNP
ncbi:S-layer homology domain-containing protein [Metasolibacillus meyeri]|uniref:S-layer homology domain-containing protein n=1 Tax=Metasolibacillus meyeri TaxID=1071052 RepID=UPI000D31B8B2|nr:S-layer homology domain-containing protein [Metasolibacillus meyeri]